MTIKEFENLPNDADLRVKHMSGRVEYTKKSNVARLTSEMLYTIDKGIFFPIISLYDETELTAEDFNKKELKKKI